ncbi:hypothetical protein [Aeromonas media]|uniref:hypothetical protein n=1 Tax=Aeromonas media TaxID=651 RepID=UPI003D1FE0E9
MTQNTHINTEQDKIIALAKKKTAEILSLEDEIDVLLAPICNQASSKSDLELINLIKSMPVGKHRELLKNELSSRRKRGFQ